MANEIKPIVVTRETISATADARDIALDAYSEVREVIQGQRYGMDVFAEVLSDVRETISGDGFGTDWLVGVASVVREAIITQAPFNAAVQWRDVICLRPTDPTYVSHIVRGLKQEVVMSHPGWPLPSTVHSLIQIPLLRQQIVQKNMRTFPRSGIYAKTLRWQYVAKAIYLPGNEVRSTTRVPQLRQMVVQSRDQVYIPVSAAYAKTLAQQAVLHRVKTAAPDVRSPINAGTLAQLVVLSQRYVEVVTDVFVGALAQQVVMDADLPPPHSPTDVFTLAHQVVMALTVQPPGIDERVATLAHQVVQQFDPDLTQIGEDDVAALAQLVVQQRDVVAYASPAEAAGLVQQVTMHRLTYPPSTALGRQSATLAQQVVLDFVPDVRRSPLYARNLRVQYTLFRNTPRPIDVIDPSVGRHVKLLRYLTVQHRVTVPPEHVDDPTHFVLNLAEAVVQKDGFPPPDYPPPETYGIGVQNVLQGVVLGDAKGWVATSPVKATSVAQTVVQGDADPAVWEDPFIPYSMAQAFNVAEAVVQEDEFPPFDAAAGDAILVSMTEAVVVTDDAFPPAGEAQSIAQVDALTESVVVTDPEWPDPTIPVSDVTVTTVTEAVAMSDPDLTGQFVMSAINVQMVARFAIIKDPTLVGIAKRTGPRPVVTISIS